MNDHWNDPERFIGESPYEELSSAIRNTLDHATDLFGESPEEPQSKLIIDLLTITKNLAKDETSIDYFIDQLREIVRPEQPEPIIIAPPLNSEVTVMINEYCEDCYRALSQESIKQGKKQCENCIQMDYDIEYRKKYGELERQNPPQTVEDLERIHNETIKNLESRNIPTGKKDY